MTTTDTHFGVDCKFCNKPIITFEIPKNAVQTPKIEGPGLMQLTCPACGKSHAYPTTSFHGYSWPATQQ